jgi:hypothetical protein
MAQAIAPGNSKPRVDPLARLAFFLGFFIMIWPTEADMLVALVRHGEFVRAAGFSFACFIVVFAPFIVSWRRLNRQPLGLRGRGYLIATGVILVLNIISVSVIFYSESHRFYYGTYR